MFIPPALSRSFRTTSANRTRLSGGKKEKRNKSLKHFESYTFYQSFFCVESINFYMSRWPNIYNRVELALGSSGAVGAGLNGSVGEDASPA